MSEQLYFYGFLGFVIIVTLVAFFFAYKYFLKLMDKLNERMEIRRKEKLKEQKRAILEAGKLAKKKEKEDDKTKDYDPTSYKKSKWTVQYWYGRFILKFRKENVVLINMELSNGLHTKFIVKLKNDNTFKYKKKMYILDEDSKYYVTSSKIYAFDFHENFSIPIKRKIPMPSIRKTVEGSGLSEVEYMTNPSTLERFSISKIAEGIMKGQQIDEFFKKIQIMIIIILITVVIHLLLFAQKSGMLSQVQLPF